jgi:ribosomal protein S6--L-glutamate ligase
MYRNEGGDMAQSILKKELEVQGIEVINNFDLRDAYCKNGVVYTKDGFNLSSLDVLYHMNFDEKTPHVDDILKAIEYSGVEVINNMQSYFLASDKFLTNVVLKKAGIPVPDMILVSSDTCYDELKKLLTDWKSIVVKTRFGGGGKGIIKVNTVEELNDLMPLLKKCSHNVYLEKYVPFGDHDHRVEIFNGEIVGCYNRTKSHSFKTNTHAGGSIVYLGDNFEVIEIAKKAAIALDVMTTTVDILKDEITGDYVVVEVNELMGMCVYHYYKHLGIEVSDAFHHDEKKIKLLAQYINKRCRC